MRFINTKDGRDDSSSHPFCRGEAFQKTLFAFLTFLSISTFGQEVLGQFEEQVIHYETGKPLCDPVAQLQQRLDDGATKLNFEKGRGYLAALLKALHVPVSSQTLVFSKTSSQRAHTSPHTPRALYFNDEVSFGWAPESEVIDIAANEPERGTVFYTLAQTSNAPPRFTRRNDCLQCHLGPRTMNVPGWLVRSVYTDANGKPLGNIEGFVGGHNSPLETRWAGWYVTGNAGAGRHLGNLFAKDSNGLEPSVSIASSDLVTLERVFDTRRYLSAGSDVVALLVLEHEVRMHNLITRANYETRYALAEWAQSGEGRGPDSLQLCALRKTAFEDARAPAGDKPASPDWPRQRIALAGEMLLEYMLFRDEAPLRGPIRGSSDFTAQFQATGPRTADGRSLRDLDLQTRLFKYPCSFLIYSPAFDALPPVMKQYIWQRLAEILSGRQRTGVYASMPAEDRINLLEILHETKPEFANWLLSRK